MKSSIPMSFGERNQPDFSFTKLLAEKATVCPEHWHDCFEIIMVREGHFNVLLEGAAETLACGDIAIIPPGAIHGTSSDRGCIEVWVYGYTESLIYSSELSLGNMRFLAPFRSTSGGKCRILRAESNRAKALRVRLEGAMDAFLTDSPVRELRVRAEIMNVHGEIYCDYLSSADRRAYRDRYITSMELYIQSRIGEDISPYEIADALHISYSHLSRVVRGGLGCSVGDLILRMKLGYAERLMTKDPDATITEIALAVGFNSSSYFTRCFRKTRGITPDKFRKLLRKGGGV